MRILYLEDNACEAESIVRQLLEIAPHLEIKTVSSTREAVLELQPRFFELSLVGLAMTSPDRRFLVVNQKLCDMLGYAANELVGMSWADVTHSDDVEPNIHLLEQTLRGETDGYVMDKRFIHREGQIVHASISARCVRRNDGSVDYLILIVQDITERKQTEHTLQAQYSISRILSESPSISDAAVKFIQVICEGFGWEIGEMWRVDRQTNLLTCLEIWHKPGEDLAEFATAGRDYSFARGVGLPGLIWEKGQATWLSHASEADGFPRLSLARKVGLRIVCGFPVILGNETLGVLQFFGREKRGPDEHLIEMMRSICSQFGQFIERE